MSCFFQCFFCFLGFCFLFYILHVLFCRESWGSKWYPCTGSRGTRPLPFPSGNMRKWSQGSKSKHCVSCKHQTEINALWSFQGICHDVLWNESNFGNFWQKHAKTIRRYPKSIAAPVPVMRNLITRRRSSKVWLQIHWPKSHWNLWSWAPGLFSRASR